MLALVGITIAVAGLLIEGLAAAGMASHRLRHALPVKSPLDLAGPGFLLFIIGAALFALGK